jgi:hypothetical protein
MADEYATVRPWGGHRNGGLGRRDDKSLKESFPFSPLPVGADPTYTSKTVEDIGIAALNGNGGQGDLTPNIGVRQGKIKDSQGYYFLEKPFDLNYEDAPDYDEVLVSSAQGDGLPATPFVPNLNSPGGRPGTNNNLSSHNVPEWKGDIQPPGIEYGSGIQRSNPSVSSERISRQTIGDYLDSSYGSSWPHSDGSS